MSLALRVPCTPPKVTELAGRTTRTSGWLLVSAKSVGVGASVIICMACLLCAQSRAFAVASVAFAAYMQVMTVRTLHEATPNVLLARQTPIDVTEKLVWPHLGC